MLDVQQSIDTQVLLRRIEALENTVHSLKMEVERLEEENSYTAPPPGALCEADPCTHCGVCEEYEAI